MNKHYIFIGFL